MNHGCPAVLKIERFRQQLDMGHEAPLRHPAILRGHSTPEKLDHDAMYSSLYPLSIEKLRCATSMHDRLLILTLLKNRLHRSHSLSHALLDGEFLSCSPPRSEFVYEIDCAQIARRKSLVKNPKQSKRGGEHDFDHRHHNEIHGHRLAQMSLQNSEVKHTRV